MITKEKEGLMSKPFATKNMHNFMIWLNVIRSSHESYFEAALDSIDVIKKHQAQLPNSIPFPDDNVVLGGTLTSARNENCDVEAIPLWISWQERSRGFEFLSQAKWDRNELPAIC